MLHLVYSLYSLKKKRNPWLPYPILFWFSVEITLFENKFGIVQMYGESTTIQGWHVSFKKQAGICIPGRKLFSYTFINESFNFARSSSSLPLMSCRSSTSLWQLVGVFKMVVEKGGKGGILLKLLYFTIKSQNEPIFAR